MFCSIMALTSCGDDNDEPKVKDSITCTYQVELTADMHEICDNILVYYMDNNEVKTAVIQPGTTTWTKTVTNYTNSKGVTFAARLAPSLNENSLKDGETYDLAVIYGFKFVGSNDFSFTPQKIICKKSDGVPANKVKSWITNWCKDSKGFKFNDFNFSTVSPQLP